MGETTGCVEQTVGEIRLDLQPVDSVKQGDVCSIKVEGGDIRRGDKLYKEEIR
jgi:putative protease